MHCVRNEEMAIYTQFGHSTYNTHEHIIKDFEIIRVKDKRTHTTLLKIETKMQTFDSSFEFIIAIKFFSHEVARGINDELFPSME